MTEYIGNSYELSENFEPDSRIICKGHLGICAANFCALNAGGCVANLCGGNVSVCGVNF